MSLTPEEFARQIGALAWPWRANRGDITVAMPSGHDIRIECRPLAPTHLGALSIPATQVSVCFDDSCPMQERQTFIAALRRVCQRGGG